MNLAISLALWIPSLPMLVVCIGGIVVAARRLARQRRALHFAQIGFGALILRTIVAVSGQMMAMQPPEARGSVVVFAKKLLVMNVASYALMLAGVVFLGLAILADRPSIAARAVQETG